MSFVINMGPGRPFLSAKQRMTRQRRTYVSRWRDVSAVLFPLRYAPGRPGKRSEPVKSASLQFLLQLWVATKWVCGSRNLPPAGRLHKALVR